MSHVELLYLDHALVDLTAGRVHLTAGGSAALTPIEARLLGFLVQNGRQIVAREDLLARVWGYSPSATTRTVDRTIVRLRRKVEPDAAQPSLIHTVRGEGYRWEGPMPASDLAQSTPPVGFVGRLGALGQLRTADVAGTGIAVSGPPGIGKSSLVRAWAAGQPTRRVVWWVDVSGCGVSELLARLGDVLGTRAKGVRTALAAHPGALLVLDGADGLDGGWAEVPWLVAPDGYTVGITSRATVEGASQVPLQGLDPSDGRALLLLGAATLGHRGTPADGSALDRLVAAVDGHPLALRLLSGRVALLGAAAVAADLDRQGLPDLRRQIVEALSGDPGGREALIRLRAYRGSVSAEDGLAVGIDFDRIADLLRRSWIHRDDPSPAGFPRFRIPALVRDALPAPPSDVLDRMADHLVSWAGALAGQMVRGEDALTARARILAAQPNLLGAFDHLGASGRPDDAVQVVRIAADSGWEMGTVRRLVDRAVALPLSRPLEAEVRMLRASLLTNRRDHGDALAELQRALALTDGAPTTLRARLLVLLADALATLPDAVEAMLAEVETIPSHDPAELASARGRQATIRERFADAILHYERALAATPPGSAPQLVSAYRQIDLGRAYGAAGRRAEAVYHLAAGRAVARALGAATIEGFAWWAEGLAHLANGQLDAAEICWEGLARSAARSGVVRHLHLPQAGRAVAARLKGHREAAVDGLGAAVAALYDDASAERAWVTLWYAACLWDVGRAEDAARALAHRPVGSTAWAWARAHLGALLAGAEPDGAGRPPGARLDVLMALLRACHSR